MTFDIQAPFAGESAKQESFRKRLIAASKRRKRLELVQAARAGVSRSITLAKRKIELLTELRDRLIDEEDKLR